MSEPDPDAPARPQQAPLPRWLLVAAVTTPIVLLAVVAFALPRLGAPQPRHAAVWSADAMITGNIDILGAQ